jgi:hypothetical protein
MRIKLRRQRWSTSRRLRTRIKFRGRVLEGAEQGHNPEGFQGHQAWPVASAEELERELSYYCPLASPLTSTIVP